MLNGVPIGSIFNIDNRDIPGLKVIYVDENGAGYVNSKIEDDELEKMKIKNYHDVYPLPVGSDRRKDLFHSRVYI